MDVVRKFNFDVNEGKMVVNNINITITGDYETPLFAGKEMCDALGYKNSQKALFTHVKPKHKKTLEEIKKLGHAVGNLSYHEGKAVYISKEGLEELISKSKLVTESEWGCRRPC
jgi:prophage antirepressor-like protein